ncbi:tetratricopeptide repeat protein [Streptomyces sp. NPDC021224]|uniref:tetratricopeptide repeat protein n=1 Tax=unclassified Streptomyces TaxID=2593676 RepID=UPI0037A0C44E
MDEVSAVDGGVAVGGDARMNAPGGMAVGSVKGDVYIHPTPAGQAPGPVVALPPAPPVFVGREAEADHVLSILRPDDGGTASVVVSAVAGLGGIGKTALALHAAHHAVRREWFTDVVLVDLRGYDPDPLTAHQALDLVLRTLRVAADDIPSAPDERAARYGSVLSSLGREGRRVLVVADNASSSDQIRPLLPAGDRHRLLVTSRHTHPDLGARLIDLDTLAPGAGVDLLRATLEAARPGDTRTHDTPEAALELATWCGGLPLALRINAAALVLDPEQTLPELLDELRAHSSRIDAVDAYTGLTGTQRALRATFDLSHQHLPAGHRQLLHLLAIAPGSDIGLPAATALAGRPAPEVRAALRELTRAHLLTHRSGPAGSRWSMHDLTRDHNTPAAPGEDGADDEAVTRLLDHYRGCAQDADTHLRALPGESVPDTFTGRPDAVAWFDAEQDNLLAAGRTHRTFATAILSAYLGDYLDLRRRFDEAVEVHTRAVAFFRDTGDRHREGISLGNLGGSLWDVGRFGEAIEAHTEHLAICREREDRRGEGVALNNLGLVLREMGRVEEAVEAHTADLEICRETGDRRGESKALNNLGLALQELGRSDDALAMFTTAVEICRETRDRAIEGSVMNNLGITLREMGRVEEAVQAHTTDLEICQEVGDRHGEGVALNNLCFALQELGRLDEAAAACTQAVEIYRETRDARRAEQARTTLALLREAQEETARQ